MGVRWWDQADIYLAGAREMVALVTESYEDEYGV